MDTAIAMLLAFFAIAAVAATWILVDDSRKRKNARRMRPRPTLKTASTGPSASEQRSSAEGLGFARRSHLNGEEAAADRGDLSKGAA